MREVEVLYGREGATLRLPGDVHLLLGRDPPPLADPGSAVRSALSRPIGSPSLAALVEARRPARVAITISDITRPVPNREFLPALLGVLNGAGVPDHAVTVIIGTGMHRPSTASERESLLGRELLGRLAVVDHRASDPAALVEVSVDPPVRVNRQFVEADFRIATGYIEPHFMAGFSGGRKGVCPALTDLCTIERFHSHETLAHPQARSGVLQGNPCHEISLGLARRVGVDFLFNVALTRERCLAGIYCGELEQAHVTGCREVSQWTTAHPDGTYDLVVTSGGGYPLDLTFYQSVKGQVEALPALGGHSTLLQLTRCEEGLGSPAYAELLMRWGRRWREFLDHLACNPTVTELDQWELQMQCRVLARIGAERLWLASDGLTPQIQRRIAVTRVPGQGDAATRAQRSVDRFLAEHPRARVAAIPDGPYTMLARQASEV